MPRVKHPPKVKPPPVQKYPKRRSPFNFNLHGFGFGHSASAALPALRAAVLKVGQALVGGDSSGTARGAYSVDLQGERTSPNQVANAQKAVAIGNECTASAQGALALGLGATANATNAVGIGNQSWGGAADAIALGSLSFAGGVRSNALGYNAVANVDKVTVISGPIMGQIGNFQAQADWLEQLASAEVILRTGWIDAKVVADYVLTLPGGFAQGCRFWILELGIIVSDFTGVTAQPFIHFGINGTPQKDLANVQTVNLTALGRRQRYVPLAPDDGELSLLFGIATAATGAGMKLSAYWRGILLESS